MDCGAGNPSAGFRCSVHDEVPDCMLSLCYATAGAIRFLCRAQMPLACAPSNRTPVFDDQMRRGLSRQHATARARPMPSIRLLSGLAALRTRPCASPQSNRKRCANLCQRHLQLRLLVDEWDLPVWSTTRVEVNTGGGGRRRWSDAREGRLSGNFTLVSGPKPSQIWLDRSSIWWMPN